MWKRRKSIGRVILLIDNRSTVRPLFDRDNRLAIIGGLAAAVPVRSKVTRQFRLLPPRRPTYGLTDLSPWKLISSESGGVSEWRHSLRPPFPKFHRNFDEIFARQSAGTRGGREYCSVGDKPGGRGEPVAI